MTPTVRVHRRTPESDLVAQCLQLLQTLGVYAWRQNQGAATAEQQGKRRFVRFTSRTGISDILGVLPGGRLLAVECKAGRNQPTAEQQAFLDEVARAGGLALVVRDVAELAAVLRPDDLAGASVQAPVRRRRQARSRQRGLFE